jgi:hypothetical protein
LRCFVRVDFSKVTQGTVAVVTPILCEKELYAVQFVNAVCDFVTIAQYRSHGDDTMAYLENTLKRIDALKLVFEPFRPRKKDQP